MKKTFAAPGPGRRTPIIITLLGLAMIYIVFSAGCASVGRDFPDAKVQEIKIGTTTQNEIRAMFGPPWRVGIDDGQQTWTYGRYHYKLLGSRDAKDLVVRFDKHNVVASYSFNTTNPQE